MTRMEWLALLLAAAAVIFQNGVRPTVGLADNGDFPKILGQFDVGNPNGNQDVFRFADLRHVVDPKYHYESGFISSELLLFAAAFGLNAVFFSASVFDLRLLAAVHAGMFLLAFYLILPLLRAYRTAFRFAVLFILLVIFTDVMYVSYFNSVYMDTAALVFLLLSLAFFLRALHWRKPADGWMFVVSVVLLITSKTQHFPLGIPIALLLAWKGGELTLGRGRVFRIASVTSVLAATAFSSQLATPSYYPSMGSYSVIFFEMLPKSKTVASDLKELGLDDSYQRYVGSNAYSADSGLKDPEFKEAFIRKGLYGRLGRFFMRHPMRALDVAVWRLDDAGRQRPRIGNFDRRVGFPELAESRTFAVWSSLKAAAFHQHGGRYLLYSLLLAMFVPGFAILRRESLPKAVPAAVVVLAAMMLLELLVASFADALDPERHFSLFSTMTDLLLICGVCLAFSPAKASSRIS